MVIVGDTFALLVPVPGVGHPAAPAELRYRIIDKTGKDIQPFFVNRGRRIAPLTPALTGGEP